MNSKRIGGEKHLSQQSSLHDWISDSGYGMIGFQADCDLPQDLIEYCKQAYTAFQIPLPPEELVRAAVWCTYQVIDCYDPYSILCGVSDIDVSPDWQTHAYEIEVSPGKFEMADPEQLETFVPMPGQDEHTYLELLNQYQHGLDALPYGVGATIRDCLQGDVAGPDIQERISDESLAWVDAQCRSASGELDLQKKAAFFELAAWAAYLWFIGPPGRTFRHGTHDLFFLAYKDGSVVLYEGVFISKDYYTKSDRPPLSCVVCGLDSWCVELGYVGGSSRFLCEKHLNGDIPLYGTANCGSRACRSVECPYHPAHGQSDGLVNTLRGRGQLAAMAQQSRLALEGGSRPKLLAN